MKSKCLLSEKVSVLMFFFILSSALIGPSILSAASPGPEDSTAAEQMGMVHYWKMDEDSGPTYSDSIASQDAQASNTGPAPVGGVFNGAQRFGGNNELNVNPSDTFDWVDREDPENPANTSFSIEYWVRKEDAPSTNQVVIGRDDDVTALHWWTGVRPEKTTSFTLYGATGEGRTIFGSKVVLDGKWHHVVAVRDSVAEQNRLYVDGVEDASGSAVYPPEAFVSQADLNIGWLNINPFYHYEGDLDEVAFYNRALTADEILQHFNAGRTGDLTGDNMVDLLDAIAGLKMLSGVTVEITGADLDIDEDGRIEMQDIVFGLQRTAGTRTVKYELPTQTD